MRINRWFSTDIFQGFRIKNLLMVVVALVVLNGLLWLSTRTILQQGFEKLESQQALRDMKRGINAIATDLSALATTCRDWSTWDDTYQFVVDRNEDYLESNVVESTFVQLELDVLLIFDVNNHLIFGQAYDLQAAAEKPLPSATVQAVRDFLDQLPADKRMTANDGVLKLAGGPLLLSAQPILTSNGLGPRRGIMVMGRFLTAERMALLAVRSELSLALQPAGEFLRNVQDQSRDIFEYQGKSLYFDKVDNQLLVGKALFTDLRGKPAFTLAERIPRQIHYQGQVTLHYFLNWVFIASLILGGVFLLLLNWLALHRRQKSEGDAFFNTVFRHAGSGMYSYDTTGRILSANPSFCQLLGYTEDELRGMNLLDITHPEEREISRKRMQEAVATKKTGCAFEKRFQGKNKQEVFGHVTGAWLFNTQGMSTQAIAMFQDMTERRRMEQVLRESEARFRAFLDNLPNIAVQGYHPDGRVKYWNRANLKIFGYSAEEALDRNFMELIVPVELRDMAQTVLQAARGHGTMPSPTELLLLRKDGERVPVFSSHYLMQGAGGESELICVHVDLREIKEAEAKLLEKDQRLKHLIHHDVLTNLPNRALFYDRLEQALQKASRHGQRVALLFLDLDRFKNVNDSLGHDIGDQLLREVAGRLTECVRSSDSLARFGGDEFVIIIDPVQSLRGITVVAEKILGSLPRAFEIQGVELFVTPSIGISLFPSDGQDVEGMVRCAEVAMYRAKEEGRNNFQFYMPDMTSRSREVLLLEAGLRKAVQNKEFLIHYQPQVDLNDGKILGVEALVRWQHPERGLIFPGQFIPLAEQTGLITEIGEWVLREACRQMRQWQEQLQQPLTLSVNISARQFRHLGLLESLAVILEETGLPPQTLELEITESIIMEDLDQAITIMHQIKQMGVNIAIDDFGTGYSSLSYLKRFPLSRLKIDQSFVRDVVEDSNDAEIAASVIALAQNMRLEVVAEGVETEAQRAFLVDKGCRLAQGFLFSRPQSAEQVVVLLEKGAVTPEDQSPTDAFDGNGA